jgi:hypothetical protein
MQDQDTRLNAVIFRRRYGNRAHSARVFVLLDPAIHMLIDEHPHFRRPGLNAGAGVFAVLQGDDELRPLAVRDIEGCGFPGEQRAGGGRARGCFARGGGVAGRVIGPACGPVRCLRWRSL